MTMVRSVYGCRSCNLVFFAGTSAGPSIFPDLYHYSVCRNCGLMYQLKSTSFSLIHPLDKLLFRIPNYVPANPKRKEIDTIKANIHKDMKMKDIAQVMNKLPIRKNWLSMFNYRYKECQSVLKKDVSQMKAIELLDACVEYEHTIYKRSTTAKICEIYGSETFWESIDNDPMFIFSNKNKHIRPLPQFDIELRESLITFEAQESVPREEIRAFRNFTEVECINCNSINSIGSSRGNCPRCQKFETIIELY